MPYALVAHKPGSADALVKQEFDLPEPGDGEVLLMHTAIGVNFIDVYFRKGLYPWPDPSGFIPGAEAAGVVKAVGPGVNGLKPGDRVAYTLPHGAYTSHRLIEARHVIPLPAAINDTTAACALLKGLTAHYLLHRSFSARSGQTVLVHAAAGGVGLIAGQWLASKGVTAIGTAGSAAKCALAREYGYSYAIDYQSQDFVAQVMDITDGEGVDAVYDSIGEATFAGSLRCLRTFGTLVSFGQSSGPPPAIEMSELATRSLTVTRPSLFHFTEEPHWQENAAAELFRLIENGDIRIPINNSYPLEEVGRAHAALEARETTGCTVLLP